VHNGAVHQHAQSIEVNVLPGQRQTRGAEGKTVAPQWRLCGGRQLLEQENVIDCVSDQPVGIPGQLCGQADGEKFQAPVSQFTHLVGQILVEVAGLEGSGKR
jgi:hypothetical protein